MTHPRTSPHQPLRKLASGNWAYHRGNGIYVIMPKRTITVTTTEDGNPPMITPTSHQNNNTFWIG